MDEITKELLDALKDLICANAIPSTGCKERAAYDKACIAIAKAEAILAAPQPSDNEWIPWAGGKCPVPNGTVVDVEYRDGYFRCNLPANEYLDCPEDDASPEYWLAEGMSNDIVAYRVVKP